MTTPDKQHSVSLPPVALGLALGLALGVCWLEIHRPALAPRPAVLTRDHPEIAPAEITTATHAIVTVRCGEAVMEAVRPKDRRFWGVRCHACGAMFSDVDGNGPCTVYEARTGFKNVLHDGCVRCFTEAFAAVASASR